MKYLLFMISPFFICALAMAQDKHLKKIMSGLEFGLNNAQQPLRQTEYDAVSRNGIRAGILLEKPATRRLTFISSLSFVQSGGKNVKFSNNDERMNYAELGIKAVKYSPVGGSDFFLSLGPYFSYGINGKVTNSNGETLTNNVFDLAEYNRFDWGFGGNLGFKTPWGTYLQGGIQTAFNNFYEQNESKYFNLSFMLTAGHTLGWRNFKSYSKLR
jgi:hypothetical protein